MANRILSAQITSHLRKDARNRFGTGPVNIRFHAEIQNGYKSGHEMLHGTVSELGDFEINGVAIAGEDGTYAYQVRMTWNDVINPNPTYIMDTISSGVLSIFNPQDYNIHISWSQTILIIP